MGEALERTNICFFFFVFFLLSFHFFVLPFSFLLCILSLSFQPIFLIKENLLKRSPLFSSRSCICPLYFCFFACSLPEEISSLLEKKSRSGQLYLALWEGTSQSWQTSPGTRSKINTFIWAPVVKLPSPQLWYKDLLTNLGVFLQIWKSWSALDLSEHFCLPFRSSSRKF